MNDKIIFYDYLNYKKHIGWDYNKNNNSWKRPSNVKEARYDSRLLQSIPDYYFLGFPIKKLLISTYSLGYSHATSLALSLCFDDFEIITGKINSIEHSFIVVPIEDKKQVIDTSLGIITDYNTYKEYLKMDIIGSISSKELKETKVYKFIDKVKNIKGPSHEDELKQNEKYEEYISMVYDYMEICKNYKNEDNKFLQEFINNYLYKNSNSGILYNWRFRLSFNTVAGYDIDYPNNSMFSLTDDEFDNTLKTSSVKVKEKSNK